MPGLEAPELHEQHYACVFFSDLRPFPEEQPRRTGWWGRDPRCDQRLFGIFDLPGGEARLQHDSDIDTGVRSLARIMTKQSEHGQKCRTANLPENIPLIGVLMENAHANRLFEQARDITVEVTRPGKVTLYLEPFAPFNWHVKPGPKTEITAVMYKEGVGGATPAGKRVEGISSTAEIRNIRPAGMDKICNDLQGLGQTANNAPAILTLDHELNSLTGRGLDSILTKEGDAVLQPATDSEKGALAIYRALMCSPRSTSITILRQSRRYSNCCPVKGGFSQLKKKKTHGFRKKVEKTIDRQKQSAIFPA